MKTFARLHLYPHSDPRGRAYIVADPAALRALSELCKTASHSMTGVENATFFGSDGHEFELVVVSDVSDDEWQQLALPGLDINGADSLNTVQLFDELIDQRDKNKLAKNAVYP